MSKLQSILNPTGRYSDIGLLIMRVAVGGCLVLKHGTEKAFDFQTMLHNTRLPFPDPLHTGVATSLTIALLSDFLCGIFVALGVGTRIAAGFAFVNILVAWILVHHLSFFGPRGDHGEIMMLMMGAMLGLVFTGAGKYSVDYLATRPR